MTPPLYKIGFISKTHGISGEVNFSFTDDSWDDVETDHIFLRIDGLAVPFFFEEYRFRNDTTAIVKFEDVNDEPAARTLVGCDVLLERSLQQHDEDEYTWSQFIDLNVINNGTHLGVITGVDDSTENVLFNLLLENGTDVLVPAVEEWIDNIDWENNIIKMHIPDEIITLN